MNRGPLPPSKCLRTCTAQGWGLLPLLVASSSTPGTYSLRRQTSSSPRPPSQLDVAARAQGAASAPLPQEVPLSLGRRASALGPFRSWMGSARGAVLVRVGAAASKRAQLGVSSFPATEGAMSMRRTALGLCASPRRTSLQLHARRHARSVHGERRSEWALGAGLLHFWGPRSRHCLKRIVPRRIAVAGRDEGSDAGSPPVVSSAARRRAPTQTHSWGMGRARRPDDSPDSCVLRGPSQGGPWGPLLAMTPP